MVHRFLGRLFGRPAQLSCRQHWEERARQRGPYAVVRKTHAREDLDKITRLQHPDVYIAPAEIHYFDKQHNYRKGLRWSEQHFANATGYHAVGEKTPDYLWANGQGVEGHLPDAHRNTHETLPAARLIVLLRNPVDRAVSAVKHIIGSGRISPLNAIDDLLAGRKQSLVDGHGVLDYGFYYRQPKAYRDYFDRRQLLVLIYEEDVIAAPAEGLAKVCEFFEIDSAFAFSWHTGTRQCASPFARQPASELPLPRPPAAQQADWSASAQVRRPSEPGRGGRAVPPV